MIRCRVLISGQVQGVNFRHTCRMVARDRGVNGWVRNLPDGRVEAVFEGSAADVGDLVEWARHGPVMATVTDVAVQSEEPEGLTSFLIR